MAKRKIVVTEQIPTESPDELKQEIKQCEERYKQSFKGTSCREILDSYYALQAAKKRYYLSINSPGETEDVTKYVIEHSSKDS